MPASIKTYARNWRRASHYRSSAHRAAIPIQFISRRLLFQTPGMKSSCRTQKIFITVSRIYKRSSTLREFLPLVTAYPGCPGISGIVCGKTKSRVANADKVISWDRARGCADMWIEAAQISDSLPRRTASSSSEQKNHLRPDIFFAYHLLFPVFRTKYPHLALYQSTRHVNAAV